MVVLRYCSTILGLVGRRETKNGDDKLRRRLVILGAHPKMQNEAKALAHETLETTFIVC